MTGRLILLLTVLLAAMVHAEPRLQLAPRSIGPAGMSGRITAIAVAPDDRRVWYIGSASGGLWKTKNAGTTFEPVFDSQPTQSIGAVALAPSNPDVVYVGTGEGNPRNSQSSGNGLYKSYDGGATWQFLGLPGSRNVHRLLVHPRDENIVWAGVLGDPFADSQERGLYRSRDGGKTWQRLLFSNPRSGIADLVMDPQNPNKLFAALWEFRRRPWDFVSGGAGSGLYLSHDGGDSWQRLGAESGLPEAPLGRIGLAIAAGQRERIYALVESETNALYRSDDGGASWQVINTQTIGSRPFYFADIYVDPRNENRVYNLYSRLARSEDGGANFEVIEDWGREVHADHHAFWIDPQDPDFIIDGTDGGLYWSYDRGEHWRFAENLPLGQFYHVTLDDRVPYNVYGGLQDNGTWYGPSEVWNRGGIRNAYWRELAFNDGFDVVLDQSDEDLLYALWQGGMLLRVNMRTGERKTIAPVAGSEELRFNWNAAIAADPFAPGTIYIGSQFVHRSRDRGDSWEVISPDLTSNDPAKQRQRSSGGLTIDATAAENHTAITVIAPSALQRGLIWVGSDDGRLHLTRDGGTTWQDLSANMVGAPAAGFIRQVVASVHDPAAAIVVIDNHLQGDWKPYVFATRDFGVSWSNLLEGADIPAYALSFVQDPLEPRLMFTGTEFGLYVSLDAGQSWAHWARGFPAVSTMDLRIHPREGDLVLGTFGRSIWVLDDLTPWRELAADPELTAKALHLFAPAPVFQPVMQQARGQRLSPDHLYAGDNNAREALLSFWLGGEAAGDVSVEIRRGEETLHRFETTAEPGLNRTSWDLQWQGREIYGPLMSPDLERPLAAPGEYEVVLRAGEHIERAGLTLLPDPSVAYSAAAYADNHAFRMELEEMYRDMQAIRAQLACMHEAQTAHAGEADAPAVAALADAIDRVWSRIEYRDVQGTISDSPRLGHRLSKAFYYTHTPYRALTDNDHALLRGLRAQSTALARAFGALEQGPWQAYQAQVFMQGNRLTDCSGAAAGVDAE